MRGGAQLLTTDRPHDDLNATDLMPQETRRTLIQFVVRIVRLRQMATTQTLLMNALAREGQHLLQQFAQALTQWGEIPQHIVDRHREEGQPPSEVARFILAQVRKFLEDANSLASLCAAGHAGPSHSLLRVCRENVVCSLFAATLTENAAPKFLEYIQVQKPASEDLRRHHKVSRILSTWQGQLSQDAQSRLERALLSNDELNEARSLKKTAERNRSQFGLESMVDAVTKWMITQDNPDSSMMLSMIVDYSIESEVVHSGRDALHLYHLPEWGASHPLHRVLSCLSTLLELRVCCTLAHASLLISLKQTGIDAPKRVEEIQRLSAAALALIDLGKSALDENGTSAEDETPDHDST